MPGAITLLTGPSRCGKTALCRELAREGTSLGRDIAGIISPARFTNGHKVGIEAVDLRSGETRTLATLQESARSDPHQLGLWRFDEACFEWGNAVLRQAVPCDVLVVDELGPLEWEQGRGWLAGLEAVDSGDYERALVVVRPALVPRALSRWPRAETAQASELDACKQLMASLRRAHSTRKAPR